MPTKRAVLVKCSVFECGQCLICRNNINIYAPGTIIETDFTNLKDALLREEYKKVNGLKGIIMCALNNEISASFVHYAVSWDYLDDRLDAFLKLYYGPNKPSRHTKVAHCFIKKVS